MSYCPRSSLPAHVLAWLARRLAHLLPPRSPGQGGNPPLSLEVRLDAVGAVILDGLSYRRAGRMVAICETEVGDSLDLLLGPLGALGFCQPDGRSSRSGIWATPGRCAAGGGCCTGSAMSFGPPPRWSVSAGGSAGYLPEQASRTPSVRRPGRPFAARGAGRHAVRVPPWCRSPGGGSDTGPAVPP